MEEESSSDSYSTSCTIDSLAAPSEHLSVVAFTLLRELAQGHRDVRIYLVETDVQIEEGLNPDESAVVFLRLKDNWRSGVGDWAATGREVLKTSASSLEREGRMMERVVGRNVVRLSGRGQDERLGFWLLMEWCELGDLFRMVMRHGAFLEKVARLVVSQIVGALQTCHNADMAHLDVKLENCYVCIDGTVKLGDFGHARSNNSTLKDTKAGTLQYQAPEIRSKQRYDGCTADIFSLGVCAFILLFGSRPWKCASPSDFCYSMYLNRRQDFWCHQTAVVSPAALSFLEALMTVDPKERPDLVGVRTHAWLKGPKDGGEWALMLR
jgi:serine/threonine protein kinase